MSVDADRLEEGAREELAYLWSDLSNARHSAINGSWSIACDSIMHRIKALTTLVGPTPWDEIKIELLEAGIYQRIHAELGIEVQPDMGRVAQVRARLDAESAKIRARR
jgi:hypothetical protein